jgi:hypothetical protein
LRCRREQPIKSDEGPTWVNLSSRMLQRGVSFSVAGAFFRDPQLKRGLVPRQLILHCSAVCISRLSTNHLKAFTYNCKPYTRERLIDADFLCMSHIFQSTSRLVHLYITRSQQWSQENIDVIEVLISLTAGEHMAPSRNQTPYEEGQESLFTWRTRLPFIISLPYQAAKDGFPSKHGFVGLFPYKAPSSILHFQAGKH